MADRVIDIKSAPEYEVRLRNLAEENGVLISKFQSADSATPTSNFPNLDPETVEMIKNATVIIEAGAASLAFLKGLVDLIRVSNGRVDAIDRITKRSLVEKK